ncbi:MAG: class I SAM-dependent methyltransferase [Ilumatobacteraceae bacterium]
MPASQRKRLGAWYTPPALVDAVVGALDLAGVVASCDSRPVRVLDPACGDGRFLTAVGSALASIGAAASLVGVDIDPGAGATWCADALALDWDEASFDVVVGNPPFLNQLARATSRGGSSRWGGGPYADTAAEFLALAAHVVRPGGAVGLVLPQSVLAARDAAAIRARVDSAMALRWCWWSGDEPMFDAAVDTWAGVWSAGGMAGPVARCRGASFTSVSSMPIPVPVPGAVASAPQTVQLSLPLPSSPSGTSWSWTMADADAPAVDADAPRLGSIASFAVDFRDVYYGLVDAVTDDGDGPPLVTCGLIDPGSCAWGERPVRFAKRRWAAPRVALDRLSPAMRRWAERRLVPKILVANQTATIEAVHDPAGEWLPGVPVLTCTTDDPGRVLDVLASPAATAWVRHHAAGSGLGANVVRLTPALLSSIPLGA